MWRYTVDVKNIHPLVQSATSVMGEGRRVVVEGGENEAGKIITSWDQVIALTSVANSTAKKALDWMRNKGVIGYEGYKNGVGIRIFFNRAKNSIGKKIYPKLLFQPLTLVFHRL